MADSRGNPNTICQVTSNGILAEISPATAATIYGAPNIKTPTKNFTLNYRGMHLNCFKNVPLICDAALLAALAAISAPVV